MFLWLGESFPCLVRLKLLSDLELSTVQELKKWGNRKHFSFNSSTTRHLDKLCTSEDSRVPYSRGGDRSSKVPYIYDKVCEKLFPRWKII